MASLPPNDLIIGMIVVAVAVFVIYMFLRATRGDKPKENKKERVSPSEGIAAEWESSLGSV